MCFLLAAPFFSGITWAVALAVLGAPLHRWMTERFKSQSISAGAACFVIGATLLVPTYLVGARVVTESSDVLDGLKELQSQGGVQSLVDQNPRLANLVQMVDIDWGKEGERLRGALNGQIAVFAQGTIWTVVNLLVTFFLLFYFFRDRLQVLGLVRLLLPVSNREAEMVLVRTQEMIRSILYGSLFIAAVQGTLGGLMFWILGIPGALLWGVIMGLLSIVPVLGAFVVWVPAAIYLAAQGDVVKALILIVWGTVVVGLVDNLLFPIVVGKDTRMHTVPVFIAIVGGLILFGAAGLVIGPAVLAVTWSLLNVLRNRMLLHHDAVDEPVK